MAADRRGLPRSRISRRGDPHRSRPHSTKHTRRKNHAERNHRHPQREPQRLPSRARRRRGARPPLGRPPARHKGEAGRAPRRGSRLPSQGTGGTHLRLPRGARRHRPGQPHLRLRRLGLRARWPRRAAREREHRREDGETRRMRAYAATVRVTVPGSPSRTDVGFHAVVEETAEGHETAFKGAVTDALKRALRGYGEQFGNSLYGDAAPGDVAPALRRTIVELGRKQGFDEGQVRDAVRSRTGKDLDELPVAEVTSLLQAMGPEASDLHHGGRAEGRLTVTPRRSRKGAPNTESTLRGWLRHRSARVRSLRYPHPRRQPPPQRGDFEDVTHDQSSRTAGTGRDRPRDALQPGRGPPSPPFGWRPTAAARTATPRPTGTPSSAGASRQRRWRST